jgi:hypothetical protein
VPTDVFKTRKGAPAVEINGVGLIDDDHSVPLDRAALVMGELQDKNGRPLTGTALRAAAKRWAEAVGLQVAGEDPQPARPQRKRPRARRKATIAAASPELQVGQGASDPEDDPAAAAAVATAETIEPSAAPAADEIKE